MNLYADYYRRADVLDRWANIYGGKSVAADWFRFEAAKLRFVAELHAALEPPATKACGVDCQEAPRAMDQLTL